MTLPTEIKSLEDIKEVRETQLIKEVNELLSSESWRLLGFGIERIRNPIKGHQQEAYRLHGSDSGKATIYVEKLEAFYILGRYK